VFFCKIDPPLLRADFATFAKLQHEVILISGNSDNIISEEYLPLPPNLRYWFSTNVLTPHPVITPIPFGMGNPYDASRLGHGIGYDRNREKHELLPLDAIESSSNTLYANFQAQTNPKVRDPVKRICIDHPRIQFDEPRLPYREMLQRMRSHAAVVCPPGNGGDTIRIYEILYAGCIPVCFNIEHFKRIFKHFNELPIVYLETINELLDVDRVITMVNTVRNDVARNKAKATIISYKYWENRIKQAINSLK
jgi:hypothetical protein